MKILGTGNLLKWFESYLKRIPIFVKNDTFYSSSRLIGQGVPQGSVLGPIFFYIHVNILALCDFKRKLFMYADDTALIASHKDFTIAEHLIQEYFNASNMWASR